MTQLQLNAETLARLIVSAQARITIEGSRLSITTPDGTSATIETAQPVIEAEDQVVNR